MAIKLDHFKAIALFFFVANRMHLTPKIEKQKKRRLVELTVVEGSQHKAQNFKWWKAILPTTKRSKTHYSVPDNKGHSNNK